MLDFNWNLCYHIWDNARTCFLLKPKCAKTHGVEVARQDGGLNFYFMKEV